MIRKIRFIHTKKDPVHGFLDTWATQKQRLWTKKWVELNYEFEELKALRFFEHLVFGFSEPHPDVTILFETEISKANKTMEAYTAFKNLTQ